MAATTAAEAAALRAELEGLRRGGAEAQGRLEALQAQLAGREAELSHLKQERHFMQVGGEMGGHTGACRADAPNTLGQREYGMYRRWLSDTVSCPVLLHTRHAQTVCHP